MISYTDARATTAVLKTYLEEGLKRPPHAATFAPFRGVAVLTQDEEKPIRETRPQLFISLERDEQRRMGLVTQAWMATLSLEVRANELSGATPPQGGEGSDSLLSRAVAQLLDVNHKDAQGLEDVRAALGALGFKSVELRGERESTKAVPGVAQQHSDPHRLSFTYFRP